MLNNVHRAELNAEYHTSRHLINNVVVTAGEAIGHKTTGVRRLRARASAHIWVFDLGLGITEMFNRRSTSSASIQSRQRQPSTHNAYAHAGGTRIRAPQRSNSRIFKFYVLSRSRIRIILL